MTRPAPPPPPPPPAPSTDGGGVPKGAWVIAGAILLAAGAIIVALVVLNDDESGPSPVASPPSAPDASGASLGPGAAAENARGAAETELIAALADAALAMEDFALDNAGSYAGASLATLEQHGLTVGPDVTFTVITTEVDHYCIEAEHERLLGRAFHLDSEIAPIPTEGTCP